MGLYDVVGTYIVTCIDWKFTLRKKDVTERHSICFPIVYLLLVELSRVVCSLKDRDTLGRAFDWVATNTFDHILGEIESYLSALSHPFINIKETKLRPFK